MSTISVFNKVNAEIAGVQVGAAEHSQTMAQKGSTELVWMSAVPDKEPLGELMI